MKILFIRHGEPDYVNDSLTEKGWREAGYLSEKMVKIPVDEIYVSPLGRARATASLTEEKLKRKAVVLDWLEEFTSRIYKPNIPERRSVAWDWLPKDWMKKEGFFDRNLWKNDEILQEGRAPEIYDHVNDCLDLFLADHGYVREGEYYRVTKANNDTIVFFCHFAIECVMLSHLLNLPPMVMLHQFCAAPTSVTTAVTEERTKGMAVFRMTSFGDTSHLYVHDEEPSFQARFCECYENKDERH
ncbi:MAG TPA: histidine phosphatase family protein [Lachnospiraceae bacterium]|nr:histidine phosphatase family protein [Lachnospiraceae bacterium]